MSEQFSDQPHTSFESEMDVAARKLMGEMLPEVDDLSLDDLLRRVRELEVHAAAALEVQKLCVELARESGATWAQLATAADLAPKECQRRWSDT